MRSRRAIIQSGMAAGATLAVPGLLLAAASPDAIKGAAGFIKAIAARAIDILQANSDKIEAREAQFRDLLSNGFDMPFIARFVLGKHWRKATPQQRADYQALFTEFILQSYSRRMGGYSGESFSVAGARAAGKKDVLVRTKIVRPGGPPIKADWRVRPKDGQYRIIDIMVEGVSMAVTQRSEFNAVVRRGGMQGLLQALRARTEKFGVAS
ncbi:MAG: ABC transporter substrate-binding protein [Rhodospirillaceae bacterium]|nr:ABC transporter substrate-binding protein [Rhodospirillaceae bacterium]MBT5894873.1 ABC transporter substrate-binding protein [Rhodospirillaceae bacterium]MBT6431050.1 ABC transporter substrate-binding protein [Rhodospirillaceae bacterium]MBT7756809.1 ABC transporter substrate-binding protein [Rhodospirillaceae bacterium]